MTVRLSNAVGVARAAVVVSIWKSGVVPIGQKALEALRR